MKYPILAISTMLLTVGCERSPESAASNEAQAAVHAAPEQASDAGKLWVAVQYADRHTCPSDKCGVVGRLFFREAATSLEKRDGWVRVSDFYNADCKSGRSTYVDKGEASCSAHNGITNGRFAEWVRTSELSPKRPPDPAIRVKPNEALVAGSDDFSQHHSAFAKVAAELIAAGRCTPGDFTEQGGWTKSGNYRDQPVYFIYCGGMAASNKIYMNAQTVAVL